ncbi:MAG: lasso RiPP family leader peptide-containing protein [Kutzneria sp.]|nr:lasso RiPP family leader peptide-containing protein [Kutzneria sp.]MBV9845293.1 lasso RiPP family leader peptide-containing protein [Kutzneria sp.]
MDEQVPVDVYQPPAVVELGEFGEDTLGAGGWTYDDIQHYGG